MRTVENIVRQEVIHCASTMLSELPFEVVESEAPELTSGPIDYHQCAMDWLEELKRSPEELANWLANHEMTQDELNDWVLEDPEQVCSDENLDPYEYEREIFEYWIVTPWLGRELADLGESVGEIYDFTIWGRPTTGQAIGQDYVMQQVADRCNARLKAWTEAAQ